MSAFLLYRKTALIRREKYERIPLNRPMLTINEHRDNSYHRSPYSPIWRWRRLLVFATEVNQKASEDAVRLTFVESVVLLVSSVRSSVGGERNLRVWQS